MSAFTDFLEPLFNEGSVRLRVKPQTTPAQPARDLVARVFADYRLGVAGPLLDFDAGTALAAAELLWFACWFLVSHDEPDAEVERRLTLPDPPTPAAHLSADLMLRYLPQVHRRARAVDPADRLTTRLAAVLRQWPLAGVLSDIEEGPTTAPDFGGHPGLLLLYAERWVRNDKPAWEPQGPGREYLELVRASGAASARR
jgi:hypothetical protein